MVLRDRLLCAVASSLILLTSAQFVHRECYDKYGDPLGLPILKNDPSWKIATYEGYKLKNNMIKPPGNDVTKAMMTGDELFPIPDACYVGDKLKTGGKHWEFKTCAGSHSADELIKFCGTACTKVQGCTAFHLKKGKEECQMFAEDFEVCGHHTKLNSACGTREIGKYDAGIKCPSTRLQLYRYAPKAMINDPKPKLTNPIWRFGWQFAFDIHDASIDCAAIQADLEKSFGDHVDKLDSVVVQCAAAPNTIPFDADPALWNACMDAGTKVIYFVAWIQTNTLAIDNLVKKVDDSFCACDCDSATTYQSHFATLSGNMKKNIDATLGKSVKITMLNAGKTTWTRGFQDATYSRDEKHFSFDLDQCIDGAGKFQGNLVRFDYGFRVWFDREMQPEDHAEINIPFFKSMKNNDDWWVPPDGCFTDSTAYGCVSDPAMPQGGKHYEMRYPCMGTMSVQEQIRTCLSVCLNLNFGRNSDQVDNWCAGVNYDEAGYAGHCHLQTPVKLIKAPSAQCTQNKGFPLGGICGRDAGFTGWPLCNELGLTEKTECGKDNFLVIACHVDPNICWDIGTGYNEETDSCGICDSGEWSKRQLKWWVERAVTPYPAGAPSTVNKCEICPPGRVCLRGDGCQYKKDGEDCPTRCKVGTYCPKGSSVQLDCPKNMYNDKTGVAICTACPENMVTYEFGSKSSKVCLCKDGMMRDGPGGVCINCKPGMACDWQSAVYIDKNALETGGFQDKNDQFAKEVNTLSLDQTRPLVQQGFWASKEKPLEVLLCGSNGFDKQCMGGNPEENTCYKNREGMLCGECPAGWQVLPEDGDCAECSGSVDAGVAVAVILVFLCILFAMKRFGNPKVQERTSQLAAVAAVGILIQFLQVLGALKSLKVDWGKVAGPIADAAATTTFRLELIKMQCMFPSTLLATFMVKMAIIPVVIGMLLLVFVLDNAWLDFRGQNNYNKKAFGTLEQFKRAKKNKVFNTIGMLMVTFYISVALTAVQPFICYEHPGTSIKSMSMHPPTRCYEGDHYTLVALGVIFSVIYTCGIFLWCAYNVSKYKMQTSADNLAFVEQNKFLFKKWHSDAYFFSCIYLARNFAIALITALIPYDNPEVQINALQLVFIFCGYLQTMYAPWRTRALNWLDTATTLGILVSLNLGAISLNEGVEQSHSTILGIALIFIALVSLAFIAWQVKNTILKVKRYVYCISHHKGAGGNTARLLKTLLEMLVGDTRVFYDCDYTGNDSGPLFEAVKETENFLALVSQELLCKKTCVGELVIASKMNVNIIPLVFRNSCKLNDQSEKADQEILEMMKAFESLSQFGISIDDCSIAITDIQERPRLECWNCFDAVSKVLSFDSKGEVKKPEFARSPSLVGKAYADLGQTVKASLLPNKSQALVDDLMDEQKGAVDAKIVIVGDVGDYEAVSVAFFLKIQLQKHLTTKIFADTLDEQFKMTSINAIANCALIVTLVTSDFWKSPSLAVRLAYLYRLPQRLIQPIVACEDFEFGSPDFYQTLAKTGSPMGKDMAEFELQMGAMTEDLSKSVNVEPVNSNELSQAYQELFKVLAMPYEINYSGPESIAIQTSAIVKRHNLDKSSLGRISIAPGAAEAKGTMSETQIIPLISKCKAQPIRTSDARLATASEAELTKELQRLTVVNAGLKKDLQNVKSAVSTMPQDGEVQV